MTYFIELIPLLCALAAVGVIVALVIIDFRHWILPNWLNAALAALGAGFHLSTGFEFFSPLQLALAALIGGGMLYIVRFFGNRYYKQETLGLGDVKLMAAAGVWLGPEMIIFAITFGAFAGLLHGIAYAAIKALKTKTRMNLRRLMIPAGPGFCCGIVAVGAWQYWNFLEGMIKILDK
ncbi:MAG: prepilin peptidase [Alphaproteobacteria bacterium]|nr:prepilin peptidase [Alphaproteobacteria bacterium]